jgi:hypothetical protein
VAEEPEESDAAYEAMERESYESPAAAETPAATESSAPSESAVEELVPAPEQVQNRPEKPNIVETDDEVLEP